MVTQTVSYVVATAFSKRRAYRASANTSTDGKSVTLHGSKIAWWNDDGSVSLTLAGYPTPTTRDRLNTICMVLGYGHPFYQQGFTQYHSGAEIGQHSVITYHPLSGELDPEKLLQEVTSGDNFGR